MLRARARLGSEEREGDGGRGVCLEACLPLPLPLHMQWGPALIKCFHVACFHVDVRHFEFLSLLRACNTCVCVIERVIYCCPIALVELLWKLYS